MTESVVEDVPRDGIATDDEIAAEEGGKGEKPAEEGGEEEKPAEEGLEETAGSTGVTDMDNAEKDEAGDTDENTKKIVEDEAVVNGQSTEEGIQNEEKGADIKEVKDGDQIVNGEDSEVSKEVNENGEKEGDVEQKTETEEKIEEKEGGEGEKADVRETDGEQGDRLALVGEGEEGKDVTDGREEDLVGGSGADKMDQTEAEEMDQGGTEGVDQSGTEGVDQGGTEKAEQQVVEDTTGERPVSGETGEAGKDQVEELKSPVGTPQLSAKPTSGSVTVLTAIKEEEEEDNNQEELKQELVEQILEAMEEKRELQAQREALENKIGQYLAKKKSEKDQLELPRPAPDARKYSLILNKIRKLREKMEKAQENQTRKEERLVAKMNSDLEQAKRAREYLIACRKERFVGLLNSRTGKRITMADLDHYHALEDEKEEEIKKIRLNNIKLAARMNKLSESLRQKEQLAQGLHMIDFEQLKINNIDLNEKIEERNDDILKLRKKVTSTVQVLTHVKEKLQFLQQEKAERKTVLGEIEAQLALKRDELTHLKQARDALRADNQRLKQKGGLVGHKTLLRDFEERLDDSEEMRKKLEELQKRHSELSVMCDGLKKKIETARQLEAQALTNR